MTGSPPPPPAPPLPVPRILHAALVGGALLTVGVLVVLRHTAPVAGAPGTFLLRSVLLGLGVVVVLAFRAARGRIVPPPVPGDEAAWWRANLGLALVSWTLADSLALVAG
ncbi:MAG: hypothetical protein ACREMV_13985, partial [Gemmatimonadales bacterium]